MCNGAQTRSPTPDTTNSVLLAGGQQVLHGGDACVLSVVNVSSGDEELCPDDLCGGALRARVGQSLVCAAGKRAAMYGKGGSHFGCVINRAGSSSPLCSPSLSTRSVASSLSSHRTPASSTPRTSRPVGRSAPRDGGRDETARLPQQLIKSQHRPTHPIPVLCQLFSRPPRPPHRRARRETSMAPRMRSVATGAHMSAIAGRGAPPRAP